jgi:hypothetical protein
MIRENAMKPFAIGLAAATLAAAASPALAHHSFAMFDQKKTMTLEATVKEFQWSSPHCWIQILTPNQAGQPQEWGVELGAPPMLNRTGWTFNTLKPGDHVTVVIHPLASGGPSGNLVKITLADGRTLGPGGPPPSLPLQPAPKS